MTIKKDLFTNEFFETGAELTVGQVSYWKKVVNSNLKFGLELETELKADVSRSSALRAMKAQFKPTNSVGNYGDYGVHSVITDGSLVNGIELPLVGRRFEYWSTVDQLTAITKALRENGAILHQRAGLHNHMLLSYQSDSKEMEKEMPGIIVRNFLQLFRRFASELVWLTSTNKGPDGEITRMNQFRKHDMLMRFTPARMNRTLQELINLLNNESYGFIRTKTMRVNGENVERFHLELRFPDGSLSPSQIVAMQALYKAMLLKAIEFSQYGIVCASGTENLYEEQKLMLNVLSNNAGHQRLSKAVPAEIREETYNLLRERAQNMVLYFTNNLKQVDEIVIGTLEKLAEKPISLRRFENDDLERIEKELLPKDNRSKETFKDIARVIDSMSIIGCESKKEWEEQLAVQLGISYKVANNKVWKFGQVRKMEFDKKLGTVIFV